jgi:hypothetical protein
MSTTPARQPAGVPVGGQFAAKSNPECSLDLSADTGAMDRYHLRVSDAVSLGSLVDAVVHNRKVARVEADGGITVGTARSVGTATGGLADENDDIRDCYMRVTGDDGFERFWRVRELAAETETGHFVSNYHSPNTERPAPVSNSAPLAEDEVRAILNDSSRSPSERVAMLQQALGDPVDAYEPPSVEYSAAAFRQHFEDNEEMESVLNGLTDDEIDGVAEEYLSSAEADVVWDTYDRAARRMIQQALAEREPKTEVHT